MSMKSGLGRVAGLLALVLLLPGRPAASESPKTAVDHLSSTTVFSEVNVVPMTGPHVLERQTVVISAGKIVHIGPASENPPVPPGAMVIDGRGQYLMPGLIDMHVHITQKNDPLLFVTNGVTTVRNTWGFTPPLTWVGYPDQLGLRDRIRRGEVMGPTIYTSGPIMDGRPSHSPLDKVITNAKQARRAVAHQKREGYDFVKVYDSLSPEAYRAIVAAAREEGLPVIGHVPRQVGLDEVLASGQLSIEHLTGYVDHDAAKLLISENDLDAAVEKSRVAGVWNTPTIVTFKARVPASEAAQLEKRPEMRFVHPSTKRVWPAMEKAVNKDLKLPNAVYVKEVTRLLSLVTKRLQAGTGRILLGTDCNNPYVIPGFSAHDELRNLVEAGLTPYEALAAGTRNAAESLGALNTLGTVEVGKQADLILVERNPLEDVSNAARRSGVMLRGRWIPATEIDAMLERLAASYR